MKQLYCSIINCNSLLCNEIQLPAIIIKVKTTNKKFYLQEFLGSQIYSIVQLKQSEGISKINIAFVEQHNKCHSR